MLLKKVGEFGIEVLDQVNRVKVRLLSFEMQVVWYEAEGKDISPFSRDHNVGARDDKDIEAANVDSRRSRTWQEEFDANTALEYDRKSRLLKSGGCQEAGSAGCGEALGSAGRTAAGGEESERERCPRAERRCVCVCVRC